MKINIRVSDNVLSEDCWPVYQLNVENGIIIGVKRLVNGVYSGSGLPKIGCTVDDIIAWSREHEDETHPQIYNEVLTPKGWKNFVTERDLLI